nr:uncharacterized protein LOC123753550 isoform X1 [Procambarus clarkii]
MWVRVNLVPIKDTEFAVANLIGGREYRFRVSAENAVGMSDPSPPSEVVSISTDQEATEPHFLKELRDAVAVENHRVEFSVHIIGTPLPDITWYKDGFEVYDTRRFEFRVEGDRYTLVLKEAKLTDEGDIRVRATNRVGVASSQAALTVQALPHIKLPAQYEQGLIFDTDELIRLRVPYTGRPQPQASWTHNGKQVEGDERHAMDVSDKYITLKIAGACRMDKGMYTLRLSNPQGEDSSSFFVTVTDRPDPPSVPTITDVSGTSVTLRWDPPQDDGGCRVSNYIVEYFRVGWDVWLKATASRITWTQLSDLIVGSEYRFRIKAENAYGVSEPGEESHQILIEDAKSATGYENVHINVNGCMQNCNQSIALEGFMTGNHSDSQVSALADQTGMVIETVSLKRSQALYEEKIMKGSRLEAFPCYYNNDDESDSDATLIDQHQIESQETDLYSSDTDISQNSEEVSSACSGTLSLDQSTTSLLGPIVVDSLGQRKSLGTYVLGAEIGMVRNGLAPAYHLGTLKSADIDSDQSDTMNSESTETCSLGTTFIATVEVYQPWATSGNSPYVYHYHSPHEREIDTARSPDPQYDELNTSCVANYSRANVNYSYSQLEREMTGSLSPNRGLKIASGTYLVDETVRNSSDNGVTGTPIVTVVSRDEVTCTPMVNVASEDGVTGTPIVSVASGDEATGTPIVSVASEDEVTGTPIVSVVSEDEVTDTAIVSVVSEDGVKVTPIVSVASEDEVTGTPIVSVVSEDGVKVTPIVSVASEDEVTGTPIVSVASEDGAKVREIVLDTAEEATANKVVRNTNISDWTNQIMKEVFKEEAPENQITTKIHNNGDVMKEVTREVYNGTTGNQVVEDGYNIGATVNQIVRDIYVNGVTAIQARKDVTGEGASTDRTMGKVYVNEINGKTVGYAGKKETATNPIRDFSKQKVVTDKKVKTVSNESLATNVAMTLSEAIPVTETSWVNSDRLRTDDHLIRSVSGETSTGNRVVRNLNNEQASCSDAGGSRNKEPGTNELHTIENEVSAAGGQWTTRGRIAIANQFRIICGGLASMTHLGNINARGQKCQGNILISEGATDYSEQMEDDDSTWSSASTLGNDRDSDSSLDAMEWGKDVRDLYDPMVRDTTVDSHIPFLSLEGPAVTMLRDMRMRRMAGNQQGLWKQQAFSSVQGTSKEDMHVNHKECMHTKNSMYSNLSHECNVQEHIAPLEQTRIKGIPTEMMVYESTEYIEAVTGFDDQSSTSHSGSVTPTNENDDFQSVRRKSVTQQGITSVHSRDLVPHLTSASLISNQQKLESPNFRHSAEDLLSSVHQNIDEVSSWEPKITQEITSRIDFLEDLVYRCMENEDVTLNTLGVSDDEGAAAPSPLAPLSRVSSSGCVGLRRGELRHLISDLSDLVTNMNEKSGTLSADNIAKFFEKTASVVREQSLSPVTYHKGSSVVDAGSHQSSRAHSVSDIDWALEDLPSRSDPGKVIETLQPYDQVHIQSSILDRITYLDDIMSRCLEHEDVTLNTLGSPVVSPHPLPAADSLEDRVDASKMELKDLIGNLGSMISGLGQKFNANWS